MDTVTVLSYIIVFLFGITVGSFVNVCILRIPKRESIVTVPSHCVSCGTRLKWFELVPLFSWLFLRGRCRTCHAPVSAQYPLIEAANGILWVLVYWRLGPVLLTVPACLLTSALLTLGVIDWRTREIPPGINIFILILGALRAVLDIANWPLYVIGLFAVSLFLLLLFFVTGGRAIGGGDVKLMAACGLFLGWKMTILAFLIGCIGGSVIHLSLMAAGKAGRELAMGPYLAAGVFTAMLWGENILGWYLGMFL